MSCDNEEMDKDGWQMLMERRKTRLYCRTGNPTKQIIIIIHLLGVFVKVQNSKILANLN